MQWPHRVERLQHDEIKRAVKDVRLVGWHVLEVYSSDVLSVNRSTPSLFEDGRVFPAGTSHAPSTAQPSGGRTWWAHFEFTRINTTPTFLCKKIEDLRQLGAFMLPVEPQSEKQARMSVAQCAVAETCAASIRVSIRSSGVY
jgi:hypothetical protein